MVLSVNQNSSLSLMCVVPDVDVAFYADAPKQVSEMPKVVTEFVPSELTWDINFGEKRNQNEDSQKIGETSKSTEKSAKSIEDKQPVAIKSLLKSVAIQKPIKASEEVKQRIPAESKKFIADNDSNKKSDIKSNGESLAKYVLSEKFVNTFKRSVKLFMLSSSNDIPARYSASDIGRTVVNRDNSNESVWKKQRQPKVHEQNTQSKFVNVKPGKTSKILAKRGLQMFQFKSLGSLLTRVSDSSHPLKAAGPIDLINCPLKEGAMVSFLTSEPVISDEALHFVGTARLLHSNVLSSPTKKGTSEKTLFNKSNQLATDLRLSLKLLRNFNSTLKTDDKFARLIKSFLPQERTANYATIYHYYNYLYDREAGNGKLTIMNEYESLVYSDSFIYSARTYAKLT